MMIFADSDTDSLRHNDPIELFRLWNQEMAANPSGDPAAMVLSTASADCMVSSRIVLLKEFGHNGFVFFTNYLSRKAFQLDTNPNASLLFYWPNQHRQVRIEGTAEKVSEEESDRYFESRPEESRIGAWASEQSMEIESRAVLAERFAQFRAKFGNKIPRPPHWGGYSLNPELFEFWQEGEHRLHDRIVFRKSNGVWKSKRLAP
jgi:pyridoxamine 5'-phosphate oxidase